MEPAKIYLKPGKEKSLRNRNPWIFSGAVARVEEFEANGQPVDVYSAQGEFLAAGYVNPESRILCRVLSWRPIPVDRALIEERIRAAIGNRSGILDERTDSCRLVNSEGDFLPGLIVDRYGEGVVVQVLTAGMERFRDDIVDILRGELRPRFIAERSDVAARLEEGLTERAGVPEGVLEGPVEILENGLRFRVDVLHGQKTGFYLDQRESRRLIGEFSGGKRVLNLCSYTGGFSVYAASGGATAVASVDSSQPALDLARENLALNGLDSVPAEYIRSDVFRFLNASEDSWDVVVLDPPAFAARKSQVDQAARGYKDLNIRSLRKIAPGGVLATFSCSHHIDRALFRQIVYSAAVDSGRDVQVLRETGHSSDHPFNICHKEGEYLKGLILRVR